MKIEKIPDSIDPSLNLEQIREECLELTKRAYWSAGAAIVPIPFFDVVVDLGMLTQIIPHINARFGLALNILVFTILKPRKSIGTNYANVVLSSLVWLSHAQR